MKLLNKWVLITGISVLTSTLAMASDRAETAWQWIDQDAVVIDVRTVGEFESGHLEGALNIPVQEIARVDLSFVKKDQPVVVYCRSGNRSGSAQQILQSKGYNQVHNGGGLDEMLSAK
jgi:phage shock protein E